MNKQIFKDEALFLNILKRIQDVFLVFVIGFFIALLLNFSGMAVVYAEEDSPTPTATPASDINLTQQMYKEMSVASKIGAEDINPNQFVSTAEQLPGSIGTLLLVLGGVEATSGKPLAYLEKKYPDLYASLPLLMREGLVGVARDYMYMAFLDDSLYIPAGPVYAEMFLPPMFKPSNSVTYAATFGNSDNAYDVLKGMTVVLKLWRFMRDVSIVVAVLMLMIAGILIMFRQKIGGQTVVNIVMGIQGLIIGLIGAIASFAIGAMFFNLSKVLIFMLAKMFLSVFSDEYNSNEKELLSPAEPYGIVTKFNSLGNFFSGMWEAGQEIFELTTGKKMGEVEGGGGDSGFWKRQWEALKENFDFGALLSGGIGGITVGIAQLLILGFITYLIFSVLWKLIKTYVNMILQIILAPLIFVLGSLPGRQEGIKNWFKKMFIYSVTPPAMFALLNFAFLFVKLDLGDRGLEGISGGAFSESATSVIFKAVGLGRIVALMMLMIVTKIDDFLKETFKLAPSQAEQQASAEGTNIMKGLMNRMGIPVL